MKIWAHSLTFGDAPWVYWEGPHGLVYAQYSAMTILQMLCLPQRSYRLTGVDPDFTPGEQVRIPSGGTSTL